MRDDLRQRIHYLIEHGGVYPPSKDRGRWWLGAGIVVLIALGLANLMLR